MYRVYIVDDELIVRQGLKNIIDWQGLGFALCGEAGDGLTAFDEIMELNPHLVLADIRMPKLSGLDLAQKLRASGYEGRIIVLSGYSEFEYAQEAIAYNVDYYLTKPIAEDELKAAVVALYGRLQEQERQSQHKSYYQEKAKPTILAEILSGQNTSLPLSSSTLQELGLEADAYQVLILEPLDPSVDAFAEVCRQLELAEDHEDLEWHEAEQSEIVLLKGKPMITSFAEYKSKQANQPGQSFAIFVGKEVADFPALYHSYQEAELVRERNFFAKQKKFIVGKEDIPELTQGVGQINLDDPTSFAQALYSQMVVHRLDECKALLAQLEADLIQSGASIAATKSYLADLLISVVQEFKQDYASYNVPFATSAELMRSIADQASLTDCLHFIATELARMTESISTFSTDGILEAVRQFINHHYHEDIKLKTIAQKFGYNSSYLGKIFNQQYKISFNDYLHQVRIEKAMELLLHADYKIYQIAELVGYSNVDYFHVKFKQYAGTTPIRYKKGEF